MNSNSSDWSWVLGIATFAWEEYWQVICITIIIIFLDPHEFNSGWMNDASDCLLKLDLNLNFVIFSLDALLNETHAIDVSKL